jgi:hypothetical protein
MKNILWYDVDTQRVKIAKHARFDEGLNDLPFNALPPTVQHMQWVRSGVRLKAEHSDQAVAQFECFNTPFRRTLTARVQVPSSNQSPTFGLRLLTDELTHRVFVQSLAPTSCAA